MRVPADLNGDRPALTDEERAALVGLCLWGAVMAERDGLHPHASLFWHGAELLLEGIDGRSS